MEPSPMFFETIMTPRRAIRGVVLTIFLASFPGVAEAQIDCASIPAGPDRTDCYLALSQFYRAQSDLAAAKARARISGRPNLRRGDDQYPLFAR